MENAEIAGRLHQPRDVHAHGRDAVRHKQQEADNTQRRFLRQRLIAGGGRLQRDGHTGVGCGVFLPEIGLAGRRDLTRGGHVLFPQGQNGLGRIRNGVVLQTARGGNEPEGKLALHRVQHAAQQEIRVCAALVDLLAGMAADEAGDGQPRAGQRAGGARQANGDVGACAAGTADGEDAFVLGVNVQHTAGRAESCEKSRPCAPSMPISSSTVNTTSSAGCAISLLSSTASAMATAMPSSPPSVVPFAET